MLEAIPWTVIFDISAQGIVVLVVIMILRGDLVPSRFYKSIEEQKEHWRKAAETLRESNALQAKAIQNQNDIGDTVVKIMTAIQDAAKKEE